MKKDEDRTLILPPGDTADTILVRKCKLHVAKGPLAGKEFTVDKDPFTIGSDSHNDLVVQDSAVSRRHCEIRLVPEGYILRDLGSTNGTVLQGVKVSHAFLVPGADILLGHTRFVFSPLPGAVPFELSPNESFGEMLGRSVPMRRVFHLAETYAPTDATILIQGDTGTGKEILAEEIHKHSLRKDKPFVVIDCATLARDVIESELFGHTKGAFTGAHGDRTGAFEHADGGTVFLDEIAELGPELQPKLLRVIEKREVRPVGSNQVRSINVRVITATNRKIENEVNAGRFREDLYYRLSVVRIDIPPLQRRKEDIPLLTRWFLRAFHGKDALEHTAHFEETMTAFSRHDWPGNVRELRNLVELASYGRRRPIDLRAFLYLGRNRNLIEQGVSAAAADRPFKDAKSEMITHFEREYVTQILNRHNGNVSQAAREARIERSYLQRLIKKYGIRS